MTLQLIDPASLTLEQFALIRNAPHLVARAVSASGGSQVDTLLERSAAKKAIANGRNNDHPLVRAIAEPEALTAAAAAVQTTMDSRGSAISFPRLAQLAVDGVREAVTVLRACGGELDLYAYQEFVLDIARDVARAAREHDLLGIGGELVSDPERALLAALEAEFR
jgi:hypothetical protein